MTDTTDLIQRLNGRATDGANNVSVSLLYEAADALEQQAAQDAINRSNIDRLAGIVNQQADEIEQQAAALAENDAEIATLKSAWDRAFRQAMENGERANGYKTELSALRADAGRWRHVQHGFAAQSVAIDGMHSWTWRGYHMIGKGANIDEAVDAALRQEQPTKGEGA